MGLRLGKHKTDGRDPAVAMKWLWRGKEKSEVPSRVDIRRKERFKTMAKKKKTGKITIDRELCKGCSLCASVCPQELIAVSEKLNQKGYYPAEYIESGMEKEERRCNACTTCAIICPDVAIEVYRE